tara:strand:+ start:8411 stop:10183 length:1773 start_codon:yes stop_codon:yes gene_type:complete
MQNKKQQNPIIRLYINLSRERRLLYFAFLSSVINRVLDLAPPVIIGLAVDIVVKEENSWISNFGIKEVPNQLIFLTFFSILIWSAESIFQYLYAVLWRNLAQISQHKLRIKAYDHIQKLDIHFFETDNTGRLLSILNDDINQLERFLDHGANELIQLFVSVIIIGSTMIYVAPQIAIFAFLPIPLILLGSIKFQGKLAPKYKDIREKAGSLSSRLNNNLSGILTIKSFTNENWELNRLKKESLLYKQSNKSAIKLSSAFIPLIRFAILFAFIAILLIGGFQVWNKELSVGSYSFLVFITQRLLWPLTTLGHVLDEFQRSMASVNRVVDLIDTPIKIRDGYKSIDSKNVVGNINFKNIFFNYPERESTLININLKIPKKSSLGIVGLTGSGKSTLIKLLLRIYDTEKGCITLDNIPIRDIKLKDLRKCVSLVSQETYLFHGTVLENIRYGSNSANFKEIRKAAKIAEADDFISKLPNGYKTTVGERGQKLSGGQRQRIALARAILKDSPILILDEATASVDNETEVLIQKSLSKISKERTTIMIAHRLSTIKNADNIIVMNKGKIIETGTHENLLKSKGFYSDLWNVQVGI